MKLTPEEHRRGLVKWNPAAKVEIQTSTANDPNEESDWSAPLSESTGSKVLSPPGHYVQLGIQVTGDGELPFPIRSDRLSSDGVVGTVIYDPVPHHGQYIKLVHIPNYGIFHRPVLEAPPALTWNEDAILRVDDVIVRLVCGPIMGERVAPLDQIEVMPDGFSLTSDWSGTAHLEGRFIEIVAPGETEAAAELNASAIRGLLALVLGASAVGEVVFSEPYRAGPREPQWGQFRTPITKLVPHAIVDTDLEAVDRTLGGLLDPNDPMMQALSLALHWFERGIRSQTPLDELICYFVGIETIVNTFAKEHGPIKQVEERQKGIGPKLKSLLTGEVDKDVIARLQDSLGQPSLRERFAFYVEFRVLEHPAVAKFKDLADARNRAFHGEPAGVTPDIASDASKLLVAMLKTELGLSFGLPWEVGPKVLSLTTHWKYADYGFHGLDRERATRGECKSLIVMVGVEPHAIRGRQSSSLRDPMAAKWPHLCRLRLRKTTWRLSQQRAASGTAGCRYAASAPGALS
jgi:hypothetical protein